MTVRQGLLSYRLTLQPLQACDVEVLWQRLDFTSMQGSANPAWNNPNVTCLTLVLPDQVRPDRVDLGRKRTFGLRRLRDVFARPQKRVETPGNIVFAKGLAGSYCSANIQARVFEALPKYGEGQRESDFLGFGARRADFTVINFDDPSGTRRRLPVRHDSLRLDHRKACRVRCAIERRADRTTCLRDFHEAPIPALR